MTYLKKYKDIFGKPNEGVHSHRILGMVSVDLFMTFIASCLISLAITKEIANIIGILYSFIGLMILGLIMHLIFGVDTTLTKLVK